MSRAACCFQNQCPESVPVTINQTTINFDGADSYFRDELFSGSTSATITLAYAPAQNASVAMFRNGVLQRQGIDYDVNGSLITLYFTRVAGDVLNFKYFSVTGISAGTVVGTIVAYDFGAGDPPAGWLKCDGATSYVKATYASLWTWLSSRPELVATSDATNFTLKYLTTTVYSSGGTLLTIPMIIRS